MTVVLLDIEGTTTPITFVYDVLFPYARRELDAFFQEHAESSTLRPLLDVLREESNRERSSGEDAPAVLSDGAAPAIAMSAATFARWQMDRDRKATGLKAIQGWIWRAGYESGELRGAVYADVPQAMARWTSDGHRVAIYSSGSIAAQRLIFGYSSEGDLTPYISSYFDTTTGPKRARESYVQIAQALGVAPEDVVFCSDNLDEIKAADSAGMKTRLVVRPGNAPVDAHAFATVKTFDAGEFGF